MKCDRCQALFSIETTPGGVAFSPPRRVEPHTKVYTVCEKYHICAECWPLFIRFMDPRP